MVQAIAPRVPVTQESPCSRGGRRIREKAYAKPNGLALIELHMLYAGTVRRRVGGLQYIGQSAKTGKPVRRRVGGLL